MVAAKAPEDQPAPTTATTARQKRHRQLAGKEHRSSIDGAEISVNTDDSSTDA